MATTHSSSLHWHDTNAAATQAGTTRWITVGDGLSHVDIFIDSAEQCDALIAAATRLRETFAE